ncbi:hypothetical protein D9615_005666 [Tricholomella constricta]|uniref:Hydrophobin n=1 Tax=Tricholomella constricta TaxID=117010 RepID=A0A8H5HAK5_9AGAR|nr:hypothetical protein D9615_005666 [Tricholomella constricta]
MAQNAKSAKLAPPAPPSPIGLGSDANCRQTPMCCSSNNYNGLVVIGCTPINVSL